MKSFLSVIISPPGTGTGSMAFLLGSIPLHYVDALLPRLSQIVGIALGVVTLYNMLNRRDGKAILDRLESGDRDFRGLHDTVDSFNIRLSRIEKTLISNNPEI